MRKARRRVLAGLGATSGILLGMAFAGGTSSTYAAYSDFAVVPASASAGVWAPNPPAECGDLSKYTNIVYGTPGDDILGSNDQPGGNHKQVLMGYAGNDVLTGGNGKDCLVGGDGDDTLIGNNGPDILIGGPGDDTCIGTRGPTVFIGCEHIQYSPPDSVHQTLLVGTSLSVQPDQSTGGAGSGEASDTVGPGNTPSQSASPSTGGDDQSPPSHDSDQEQTKDAAATSPAESNPPDTNGGTDGADGTNVASDGNGTPAAEPTP